MVAVEEAGPEVQAPPASPPPPPRLYRLFGVVVHLDWALSVGSGHYICYARRGEAWWKCDDSHVTPATEQQALGQTAYMLMYAAEECNPPPEVRPAWQTDTPEEAADEERRAAAAQAALFRERAAATAAAAARLSAAAAAASSSDTSDEESAESATLAFVPTQHGEQAAPATRSDGSAETATSWPTLLRLNLKLPDCADPASFQLAGDCVSGVGQELQLTAPPYETMVFNLPFPAQLEAEEGEEGEEARAWEPEERVLRLRLKVVAQPRAPPTPRGGGGQSAETSAFQEQLREAALARAARLGHQQP